MLTIIILIICAILIGLSKGGLGAALVVLVTPLLSFVMPVPEAVGIVLPLLILADVFALYFYWKTWDMHYIRLMLPLGIVGVIAGTYLLATLDNTTLRYILGIFTLVFIAYKVFGSRLIGQNYQPRDWHGRLAGGVSAMASALANNGAPPFTAYMLLQKVTPAVFVGTTTLFFSIINALKLPGLIVAGIFDLNNLLGVIWVVPLIPFGVWVGRKIIDRINQQVFEAIMLAVLLVAALMLLFG